MPILQNNTKRDRITRGNHPTMVRSVVAAKKVKVPKASRQAEAPEVEVSMRILLPYLSHSRVVT